MSQTSGQLSVLVVDDAKENINVLVELLRQEYIIQVATSGKKALEIAFSEYPPDIILLDILMPDMDGHEVCRRLKASAQTCNIPVIFITGKDNEEDEIIGFDLGAVDYITKPFKPVVVKARMNTHAELKRHRDNLERMSYLDGLTGINNRRKFDEYLCSTFNIACAERFSVSMIMIDIDHFKIYNDTYGHQEGDSCLTNIAKFLTSEIPSNQGFVARYGGEEFVLVLPKKTLEQTLSIAQNLCIGAENLQIPNMNSHVKPIITISLGVANINPNDIDDRFKLIQSADEALYRAKKSGRNRACI